MQLKDFAKYIRKESTDVLLHRARRKSLKRILAEDDTLESTRKKPAKRRLGTK